MENADPSLGYRILSLLLTKKELKSNIVITTNFDSLVEDSLFLFTDQKPIVCVHDSLARFAKNTNTTRPIIAKVHNGLFFAPKNTPDQTSSLSEEWKKTLNVIFSSYIPVVIGYSGADYSLMSFLEESEMDEDDKVGMFWCCYGDKLPDERIQKVVNRYNGRIVKTKGFDTLMFSMGAKIFKDDITLNATIESLDKMFSKKKSKYYEQYKEIGKSIQDDDIRKEITLIGIEEENKREKEGKLTASDYFSKAYRATNPEDAIKYYSEVIRLENDNVAAYNNRGNRYADLKRYEEAIQDYTKAIELDANYASAYNNRGVSYADLKRHEEAIQDYTKAIELDANYAVAYNNRGN
ncbi:MAG: tetratricopeptide repeat protein, partial [Firmicutes bacterium]|nr:tetratricopeptide repeat protein [Bacillota bacterium]